MELLTLNTWHGKHHDEIMKFLKKQAETVDIFCFQEVCSSGEDFTSEEGYRSNLFKSLQEVLPEFTGRHDYFSDGIGFDDIKDTPGLKMGQAFFSREGAGLDPVISAPFITRRLNEVKSINGLASWPTLMQLAELTVDGGILRVGNFHGVSQPADKRDNAERIQQSERILELVEDSSIPTIVCGDFNLFPDTESIRMFERAGFRNLVTEFGVESTRSSLSSHYGKPTEQKFADYIFTRGVDVKDFRVLPDLVSDHLALWVKF